MIVPIVLESILAGSVCGSDLVSYRTVILTAKPTNHDPLHGAETREPWSWLIIAAEFEKLLFRQTSLFIKRSHCGTVVFSSITVPTKASHKSYRAVVGSVTFQVRSNWNRFQI